MPGLTGLRRLFASGKFKRKPEIRTFYENFRKFVEDLLSFTTRARLFGTEGIFFLALILLQRITRIKAQLPDFFLDHRK